MYRVKMMSDGGVALLDNNSVYLFDKLGRVVKEKEPLLPAYIQGMNTLPVLSLVFCDGKYDIAIFDGEDFKRYKPICQPVDNIALAVNATGQFIRMLQRKGKLVDNKGASHRYNQILFIYKAGTDVERLLGGLIDEVRSN